MMSEFAKWFMYAFGILALVAGVHLVTALGSLRENPVRSVLYVGTSVAGVLVTLIAIGAL